MILISLFDESMISNLCMMIFDTGIHKIFRIKNGVSKFKIQEENMLYIEKYIYMYTGMRA